MDPALDVRYEYVLYVHTHMRTYVRTYESIWRLQQKSWNGFPGVLAISF